MLILFIRGFHGFCSFKSVSFVSSVFKKNLFNLFNPARSAMSWKGYSCWFVQFVFVFLWTDSTDFLPCFPPAREVFVHEGVEAGVVAGFEEVAEFVNHHLFHAPVGQEQEVGGEADGLGSDVADAPDAQFHRLRRVRRSVWLQALVITQQRLSHQSGSLLLFYRSRNKKIMMKFCGYK